MRENRMTRWENKMIRRTSIKMRQMNIRWNRRMKGKIRQKTRWKNRRLEVPAEVEVEKGRSGIGVEAEKGRENERREVEAGVKTGAQKK